MRNFSKSRLNSGRSCGSPPASPSPWSVWYGSAIAWSTSQSKASLPSSPFSAAVAARVSFIRW